MRVALYARVSTGRQEENIRMMVARGDKNLDGLDFNSRQKLLRLLLKKVTYNEQQVKIQTIIPLEEQLCPIARRELRG